MTGSLKLIWAIFQALFIGFVQTLGSDFWFRLDSSARASRLEMVEDVTRTIYTEGTLIGNWTSTITTNPIALSISHTLDSKAVYDQYNYTGVGCYRAKDWPWYLQSLPWRWTLPLVPTFIILLAFWNLQSIQRLKDIKHTFLMIFFGCVSYAGMDLWLFSLNPFLQYTTSKFGRGNIYSWICRECAWGFCNQSPWDTVHLAMEWLCIPCHGPWGATSSTIWAHSSWGPCTKLWV